MLSRKIDKRKSYVMVIDVETCGDRKNPLVYDIGIAIIDKRGNIYDKFSFIISEIFDNEELMLSAYYKRKIPQYLTNIDKGLSQKVKFLEMRSIFLELLRVYRVGTISAYNLRFDMRALTSTTEHLFGQGKKFLSSTYKDINLLCIWSFACEVLYSRPSFLNFVNDHDYLTKTNNPKTTVEIGYRYITNDTTFVEKHMGLDDVVAESQILAKCYIQHKRHESGIIGSPWRIVSKYKKSLE